MNLRAWWQALTLHRKVRIADARFEAHLTSCPVCGGMKTTCDLGDQLLRDREGAVDAFLGAVQH